MPLSEFEMITKYFRDASPGRPDTVLGIGDDAALISLPDGYETATVILQWLPGHDYLQTEPAANMAQRMLAKAIKELQKQSAKPAWMTLSLTFQQLDEPWLADFRQGLMALAMKHSIELIGGDTSHGPETLRMCLTGTLKIN